MDPISDLAFFALIAKQGSLSAVARELGVTPPVVSKRLAHLERRLGVRLLNRTTRRINITHEGEVYLADAARILAEVEELESRVASSRAAPKGLLRVSATFGFGRRHIAPAVSAFVKRYPEVEVQLQLTDRALNLSEQAFDVGIRFGGPPDARIMARRIAANRRLLCAAPAYLKRFGAPATPAELQKHACIVLRESDAAYGTWHFVRGRKQETVKVRGPLSSNDGETAVAWALDGHGLLLRSEWDVASHLRTGRLRPVLEEWSSPDADIYAVYPVRLNLSAKITAFVDFLSEYFGKRLKAPGGGW